MNARVTVPAALAPTSSSEKPHTGTQLRFENLSDCRIAVHTQPELRAIVDFLHGIKGTLHITFEEGIHSARLYDRLVGRVAKVVVV